MNSNSHQRIKKKMSVPVIQECQNCQHCLLPEQQNTGNAVFNICVDKEHAGEVHDDYPYDIEKGHYSVSVPDKQPYYHKIATRNKSSHIAELNVPSFGAPLDG